MRLRVESGLEVTFDAAGHKVDFDCLADFDNLLGLSTVIATNLAVTPSSYH